VLVESDGQGNSQIVHYGGDSGTIDDYRKGTLHFSTTPWSRRAARTPPWCGSRPTMSTRRPRQRGLHLCNRAALALLDASGVLELRDSWLRAGWVVSHGSFDGTFVDSGGNLEGDDPDFTDLPTQDFSPAAASPLIDAGGDLHPETLPTTSRCGNTSATSRAPPTR